MKEGSLNSSRFSQLTMTLNRPAQTAAALLDIATSDVYFAHNLAAGDAVLFVRLAETSCIE
jgi:hypothetical protein